MMKFLMVPVIMACAVGGTIGMLKATSKAAPQQVPQAPANSRIVTQMVGNMGYGKPFSGNLRDVFRNEILAHSIRILREHGRSDEEIKIELLRDFSVEPEVLDEMLRENNP